MLGLVEEEGNTTIHHHPQAPTTSIVVGNDDEKKDPNMSATTTIISLPSAATSNALVPTCHVDASFKWSLFEIFDQTTNHSTH